MALTHDDILHLSHLSRLTIDEKDIETISSQLSAVVDYFNELTTVSTDTVEETSQTTGLKDIFRADEIDSARVFPQEVATSQAHEEHNGYFVVPQIIDKE